MSVNEYETFTYEKAPDYTAAFDKASNPNAWGTAMAQERDNAAARLKNAKQFEKIVGQAQKLSLTLAKTYKDQAEKRDKRYMNEAYQLHLEAGITQSKLANWNKRNQDKKGYQKDVGLYNELAAKARAEGNHVLADRLEDMTGHKLVMAKQSLIRQGAINWRSGFEANRDNISIEREDGSILTYGSIRDENEYNQIVREHNVSMGFTDLSWASHEFVDQEFRKTMEREQANGLYEWRKTKNAQRNEERKQSWETALVEGAQTGTLGQTILELSRTQYGYSSKGTETSMREDLRDLVANLVDRNKVDPSQGIGPRAIADLENFMFPHDGMGGKLVPLSTFKEFDNRRGGGLYKKITEVQAARLTAIDNEKLVIQKNYMAELDAQVEEHGLPSRHERSQLILNFMEANPNIAVPEGLKNYMTLEDRDDQDKIEHIEWKIKNGVPVATRDWADIGDKTLRDKYKEIANGPLGSGVDASSARKRDSHLKSVVGGKLSELTGRQDEKSLEYKLMLENATAEYNQIYMRYRDKFENDGDLHDYAFEQVSKMIERGQITTTLPEPKDPRAFTSQVQSGRKWLMDGHNNGKRSSSLLSGELIPGSEKQFKRLEKYAANPISLEVPPYYTKLAENIKGMSGWDVANLQYRSQTGKDLPKPRGEVDLEKRSPLVKYMYKTYPNGKRIDRADKMESGHDFNSEESLIPGLNLDLIQQYSGAGA